MVGDNQVFRQFAEVQYQFGWWLHRQRDTARRHPQVSAAQLALTVIAQVFFGLRSLLRVDQWLRTSLAVAWLRCATTGRRGSDTTLLKALGMWDRARLRQATYAVHLTLRDQGLCRTTLSTGKTVRLAIVDGTEMGGHRFSVLSVAGAVHHAVDVQPSRGRGHELADSRRLMARAVKRLGTGFATHLLYDGLMAVRKDFRRARWWWGMHLVVKTQEETLDVVQSCRAAWQRLDDEALRVAGVKVVRGVDAPRNVAYGVCAQGGIRWEGLDEPLNVAWVRETALKGKRAGQTEEFWVLTTDATLGAAELRTVAHARWGIENLGFKATNAQVGSKLGYIRNARVKETLLLLWSWGLALLGAWQWWLSQQPAWQQWGVRKTKALIGLVLTVTALGGEVSGCGGSP
jgi:hypothetical protein